MGYTYLDHRLVGSVRNRMPDCVAMFVGTTPVSLNASYKKDGRNKHHIMTFDLTAVLTLFSNASIMAGSKLRDRHTLSWALLEGTTPMTSLLYALQIAIVFWAKYSLPSLILSVTALSNAIHNPQMISCLLCMNSNLYIYTHLDKPWLWRHFVGRQHKTVLWFFWWQASMWSWHE